MKRALDEFAGRVSERFLLIALVVVLAPDLLSETDRSLLIIALRLELHRANEVDVLQLRRATVGSLRRE